MSETNASGWWLGTDGTWYSSGSAPNDSSPTEGVALDSPAVGQSLAANLPFGTKTLLVIVLVLLLLVVVGLAI
jgi:hypothetical protein